MLNNIPSRRITLVMDCFRTLFLMSAILSTSAVALPAAPSEVQMRDLRRLLDQGCAGEIKVRAEVDPVLVRADYQFFTDHTTEFSVVEHFHRRIMNQRLAIRPSLRILDFACGDGKFLASLLTETIPISQRRFVHLLDTDPFYLANAANLLQPFSSRPIRGWQYLPPGIPFDLIIAKHGLSHLASFEETWDKLLSRLAPRGIVMVTLASSKNGLNQMAEARLHKIREIRDVENELPDLPLKRLTVSDLLPLIPEGFGKIEVVPLRSDLRFIDTLENRRRINRLNFGARYSDYWERELDALFDRFKDGDFIVVPLYDEVLVVERL